MAAPGEHHGRARATHRVLKVARTVADRWRALYQPAIEEVRSGRLYVSPGASQAIVDACATPSAGDGSHLTPRERQVLQLVGEGKSTKQIAEALHISVKTAEFHRGRLMKKLNVHDTANLVRYAIREGWIAP